MKLGSPAAMSKEPGGPADAPGHVGMSVEDLESENERLRATVEQLALALKNLVIKCYSQAPSRSRWLNPELSNADEVYTALSQ